MSKMDPEVKEKWVAELRSGNRRQTKYQLRSVTPNGYAYCCLGVLCDIIPETEWQIDNVAHYRGNAEKTALPFSLAREVGLHKEAEGKLVDLNDDEGRSFKEIADWIEENL